MCYRRKYLSILIFLGSIMELRLHNYFMDLTVPLDYSGSWYICVNINYVNNKMLESDWSLTAHIYSLTLLL